MEHAPLQSSNIKSAGYNPTIKIMEITFKSGGTYKYENIEREIYAGLVSAESPGRYFQQVIRNNEVFTCTKVDESVKKENNESETPKKDFLEALAIVMKGLQDNKDAAYSWHNSIKMPVLDILIEAHTSEGVKIVGDDVSVKQTKDLAEQIAQKLMRQLFRTNTSGDMLQ